MILYASMYKEKGYLFMFEGTESKRKWKEICNLPISI